MRLVEFRSGLTYNQTMSSLLHRGALALMGALCVWPLPASEAAGIEDCLAPVIDRLLSAPLRTQDRVAFDLALGFAEILGSSGEAERLSRDLQGSCRRFADELDESSVPDRTWHADGDRLLAGLQRELDLPVEVSRPLADLLRRRLRPGQLALRFLFTGPRVRVFYLTREEAGCRELETRTAELDSLLDRLSDPLEDFARGQVDYLRIHYDMEVAHRLYRVLLQPLLEPRPGVGELFVVADQRLARLPFEALVTGFNRAAPQPEALFSEYRAADYLIDRCTVSYFLSLTDLMRRFAGGPFRLQLAAFGNPLNTGLKPHRLRRAYVADIPSSAVEIVSLGRLVPVDRGRTFLGPACTAANFERWAPRARLVHLATHFFPDRQEPDRSAFLFTPGVDGVSLYEARRLGVQRLRAELVVLSACETSECLLQRERLGGGMTAALRQIGTRAMLASLWPVDEFNSQLVPLFYRRFLAGSDPASALRGAKRELFSRISRLNGRVTISFAHPFLWANYVLVNFCGAG